MKTNTKVINEKNRLSRTKRGKKERLNNHRNKKKKKYKTIEKSESIPLVNGRYEWNVFNVENKILHHTSENGHHAALVLLEYKGKLLLAEMTHSRGKKRLKITNPNSNDERPSYIKRETVAATNKANTIPIRISHLMNKRNDVIFTAEEKEMILKSLNQKKINKDRLKILLKI